MSKRLLKLFTKMSYLVPVSVKNIDFNTFNFPTMSNCNFCMYQNRSNDFFYEISLNNLIVRFETDFVENVRLEDLDFDQRKIHFMSLPDSKIYQNIHSFLKCFDEYFKLPFNLRKIQTDKLIYHNILGTYVSNESLIIPMATLFVDGIDKLFYSNFIIRKNNEEIHIYKINQIEKMF